MTGSRAEEGRGGKGGDRAGGRVTREEEIGVIWPRAKEHRGPPWGRARSPLDLGLLVPFPGVVSQVAAIRFSSRRRGACGQRLCCGEVRFHRAAERVW